MRERHNWCRMKANFSENTVEICKKFVSFWIPYYFPTDKFGVKLPLQNAINNCLHYVQYVPLRSVLLLFCNQTAAEHIRDRDKIGVQYKQFFRKTPRKYAKNLCLFEYHIIFQPMNFVSSYRCKTQLITLRFVYNIYY